MINRLKTIKCNFTKNSNKYQDELKDAVVEVLKVMEKGSKNHKKDEWKTGKVQHLISNHLAHSENHIKSVHSRKIIRTDMGIKYKDVDLYDIEDISHAATRMLMALQLILDMRHKKNEDS